MEQRHVIPPYDERGEIDPHDRAGGVGGGSFSQILS
jgi:hypothetical protein